MYTFPCNIFEFVGVTLLFLSSFCDCFGLLLSLSVYLVKQLILVTHAKTSDLREALRYIYNLYVEYVVKNPLYVPGTPIKYVFSLLLCWIDILTD